MRYDFIKTLCLATGLIALTPYLDAADRAAFTYSDLDKIQNAASTFLPSKLTDVGDCTITLAADTTGKGWISTEFLTGICQISQNSTESKISSIPHLQAAQRHGLNKQQAQVALLMEGLAHCSNLNRSKAKIDGKAFPRNMKEQIEVGASRTMAYNAFHHIDWMSLNLRYEKDSSEKLEAILDDVNSCEEEFLSQTSGGYNAICGIQTIPQGEELNAAISVAAREPIVRYLGPTQSTVKKCGPDNTNDDMTLNDQTDEQCSNNKFLQSGSESPLGGLMARKILKTKNSIVRSVAKAEGLALGAEKANAAFDKMDSAFAPIAGTIEKNFTDYQGLVVRGQTVQEEFDYWSRGLWQEGTTNHKLNYEKSKADLLLAYNSVNSTKTQGTDTTVKTILNKIAAIQSRLEKEQTIKERAKKMCAVLFCEIASDAWDAKSKCTFSKYSACNEVKSQDYCRSQGFEEQYMHFKLADNSEQIANCRAQYLAPKQLSLK